MDAEPARTGVVDPEADVRVPHEPLGRLFLRFLRFGALAWGGPVAQIAMVQRELVEEERWMTRERFNRVLGVYQLLPGPEAFELCVHFGVLARGRLGGVLAGLGFMLPGLLLVLAAAAAYVRVGMGSPHAMAVLAGLQAAVVALVVRAVHRIGSHALHDRALVPIAIAAFVATLFGTHFAACLVVGGLAGWLAARRWRAEAAAVICAGVIVAALVGRPAIPGEPVAQAGAGAAASAAPASPGALFASGLRAGLLTFGGAYTAIPILERDAVRVNGWLTEGQFLDAIAIGGVLPAPLIIFGTFVGHLAGGLAGALAVTAGIFLPAFAFTLVGYELLDRVVRQRDVRAALDGVTAVVVGLIAATCLGLARHALDGPVAIVVFVLALVTLHAWKARLTVVAVVLGAGLASWLASVLA